MARWNVFEPRFYPCLMRGIKKVVVQDSRALNVLFLAIFLVSHGLMITYSVFAFTDVLDSYHMELPSKTGHKFLTSIVWFPVLIVYGCILNCASKRAQAEMEERSYESDQQTSASLQQHPQEESGVHLSGRRDGRWWYGKYLTLPNYSSRDSIMEETERAVLDKLEERRRILEGSDDYFGSVPDNLNDFSPTVEDNESHDSSLSVEARELDDYSPNVEERVLDDYSPSVEDFSDYFSPTFEEDESDDSSPSDEECELNDYTTSTEEIELRDTLKQITGRSSHPSMSDEQSRSASHFLQAAAVNETNSEETEL